MHTWKIAFAAALLWSIPIAGQEETETRTYTIHHGIFGEIGTLSDEITRDGPDTKVITRADITVALLGFTLHHLRLEWREVWRNQTLMDYRASTTRNGKTHLILGRHENDRFIIRAGEQEFAAPTDIHPVHPWSVRFVHATVLMSPESGSTFVAAITDKGDETLMLGGTSRRVRHYVATFDSVNHLYFDQSGTLLVAEYRDITGTVRLALQDSGERAVVAAR